MEIKLIKDNNEVTISISDIEKLYDKEFSLEITSILADMVKELERYKSN